jgi:hypothetical protein
MFFFFILDMSSDNYYSNKIIAQRELRAEKRKQTTAFPADISSSDSDDFDSNTTDYQYSIRTDDLLGSSTLGSSACLTFVCLLCKVHKKIIKYNRKLVRLYRRINMTH